MERDGKPGFLEGMERATWAFLSVIDQITEMTLAELRTPTMFQRRVC